MKIANLKNKVEYCLENYPDTRNSDIKLTNCIWIQYFNQKLFKVVETREFNIEKATYAVKLIDLYDLPKEDTVKRIRAKFNSEGKYLPTDPEVIKQRKLNEIEWHEEMSPSNPSRG